MDGPSSNASQDWGKLILRLTVGLLMLLHGVAKLNHGTDQIASMLTARGLPEAAVYGVYVGEVLAPILLILGLFTRTAGFVLAVNMVVAIWLAHAGDVFLLTPFGGWALELQGFYLFGGLAIACLGSGRLALKPG